MLYPVFEITILAVTPGFPTLVGAVVRLWLGTVASYVSTHSQRRSLILITRAGISFILWSYYHLPFLNKEK